MMDILDYDIQLIEDEILMKFNDYRNDYTEFGCLLEMRRRMINKRALAHRIWNDIKDNDSYGDDVELTAKCFLSSDYPKLE